MISDEAIKAIQHRIGCHVDNAHLYRMQGGPDDMECAETLEARAKALTEELIRLRETS